MEDVLIRILEDVIIIIIIIIMIKGGIMKKINNNNKKTKLSPQHCTLLLLKCALSSKLLFTTIMSVEA